MIGLYHCLNIPNKILNMNIITSLHLSCCFAKGFMAKSIVDAMVDHFMNDKCMDIRGNRRLTQWSTHISVFKCKTFKRVLKRNMRHAFIEHNIAAFGKTNYWSSYMGKQLSYAILQKVIHWYDDDDAIAIQLLDIPTHSLLYRVSMPNTPDFTDKNNYFLSQFAIITDGKTIDINATDPAIVNAMDIKFMYILENIVNDVDFIHDIVKQIDDKYVNDYSAYQSQQQLEINHIAHNK